MTKIKKILCPVDFFPASMTAVKYAGRLAAQTKAQLYLLHVITPVVVMDPYEYPLPYMPDVMKSMRKNSTQQMEKIAGALARQGVRVNSRLRLGNTYDEITQQVGRVKPDLLVMGTHGRGGVKRWLLGSTTEKLLRHSLIPLLVVSARNHKPQHPRFRRILVTTDLSEGSKDALAYALSFAQAGKTHVTLLHVIPDITADVSGEYRTALLSGVQQQLDGLVPSRVRAECDIVTKVDIGKPDRIIPWTIKSDKADLLIMTVHGRSLIDRALFGSTAEHVVRWATCPVLIVPALTQSKTSRIKVA